MDHGHLLCLKVQSLYLPRKQALAQNPSMNFLKKNGTGANLIIQTCWLKPDFSQDMLLKRFLFCFFDPVNAGFKECYHDLQACRFFTVIILGNSFSF